jgi:lipopolysaccharide export system protein LptA
MAKIEVLKILKNIFSSRFLWVALFLLPGSAIFCQKPSTKQVTKKKIEILNADVEDLIDDKITKQTVTHLVGNVRIKDQDVLMWCDSAHYFSDKNQLIAFSKVHISQNDTLNLYGDYLFYNGIEKSAFVKGKVELINKDTHLYTDSIHYDVRNRVARYTNRGKIINAENTLTSIIGIYYASKDLFHFKDSVKVVNPNYIMEADTMDYNTISKIAYFTGPTELKGDSIYLYCEKGWYDTQKEITSVWKNAMIDNKKQIIHGDSLYFNDNTGYGESYRNVIIEDTINKIAIEGNYAWYYKDPERFLVTDKAVFIQISDKDSLFLHADTITAKTILADNFPKGYRLMRAFHNCRIFSEKLQAKCDSLSYSFQDSVIRLYRDPIIWAEENQLTSDSMAVFTKNQKTERLELYNAAFIISQVDTIRFDQTKGRSLTGFFKDNELYKIDIRGNGEVVYYLLDEETVAGIDQSKCADIQVLLEKGKPTDIFEYDNPEGVINPPLPIKAIRLDGFRWHDNLRPKKKADIFIK